MTKNRLRLPLSLAAIALFGIQVGCDKSAIDDSRSSTFAVIGGMSLTAEYVSNTVMVCARIAELAHKPIRGDRFPYWGNGLAMKMTPELIQAFLLENELVRMGVEPTQDSDLKVLARYNSLVRQQAKTADELASLFGDLKLHFQKQFIRESRFQAFYSSQSDIEVSAKDVSLHYRNLTNDIERLEKINARAREKANTAWARLNSGESWDYVATNCTEDALLDADNADNWREWMTFNLEDTEPQELKTALSLLKIGGYTCPIETDEGLAIVRVIEREGNLISCARILFRMAIKLEIPPREEVVESLRKKKTMALQRKVLSSARERVKIEYPLGTNFTYRIWPAPAKKVISNFKTR